MERNNNNINNSSLISSLEKKGVVDMTKDFIRNTLYEKLKSNNMGNEAKVNLSPSNYNIDDQNLFTMAKLEYTLIEDFLIRTKLSYTHSIFNNEIKSKIKPLIPFDDVELMSLLGINYNELSSLRFNWNNSNDISSQIKSTYLFQLINWHTKIMKIDHETQTHDLPINEKALYNPDIRVEVDNPSDIEIKLKNIEDKYNKKLKEETDALLVENRFIKYKNEIDRKYEEELKNEIERFKSNELGIMRMEENEKYAKKLEELRKEFEDEYKKKYEDLKNIQKSIEERERNLTKEYEERYNQLKTMYEGKEKKLEYKEKYLENKYKNDTDVSAHLIKFNEELHSMREMNNGKDNNYQNSISLMKNEIGLMKKDINDITNLLNNQPLRNNYIKKEEEEKKINNNINNNLINSIKPSKESVINNLNILAKSGNNFNRSSQSQSGSGVYKSQNRKDRRKIVEDLEEEQYKLNNQFREEFQKILDSNYPLLIEKEEYSHLRKNTNNNADYLINQYREKYNYNNANKNNNIYIDDKNKDNNIYNIDNKYEQNKSSNNNNNNNNNNYNNNYNNDNNNYYNNDNNNYNNNYNYLDKNKFEKNDELVNNSHNNSKKRQNNSINRSNNKSSTSPKNDIGGFNIGGFNIGNYNYGTKNNNSNNNYTVNSESNIEENIEGEVNYNQKKENSKKNNYMSSNRFEKEAKKNPPIKEENEDYSEASNNSKQNNKYDNINDNNNLNVNKSNKFNNYNYNEIIDDDIKEEIKEDYDYGIENDTSENKKKDAYFSNVSGIVKKNIGDVSESAGGLGGLLQLQSHAAGGLGYNDKESYGDFEFSKGKNNNINNKKGNDIGLQNKYQNNQNNQNNENSEFIEEEISGY